MVEPPSLSIILIGSIMQCFQGFLLNNILQGGGVRYAVCRPAFVLAEALTEALTEAPTYQLIKKTISWCVRVHVQMVVKGSKMQVK